MKPPCAHCGSPVKQSVGSINRALKVGAPIYCDRVCSGLGRRKHLSDDQKRELKAAYDKKYRTANGDRLKRQKAAAYAVNPNREREAKYRRENMARHVEYCRRPEYKALKKDYDCAYRAKKYFGPYWESAVLLGQVQSEVLSRATRYEIDLENGKLNKTTRRKRDYEKLIRS